MRHRPLGAVFTLVFACACAATGPAPAPPPAESAPPAAAPAAAADAAPRRSASVGGLRGRAALVYPSTRREDVSDRIFGVEVADPYRWLEDEKSDEVRTWMAEQDALARSALAGLPGRGELAARLKQLLYYDAVSPPRRRGRRFFYTQRHADREKAVVYFREGEKGPERVLLDPNLMSPDGSTSLGTWVPSWDGRKVAYALKVRNSDEATIHVMDVGSGEVSKTDVVPGAKYGSPSWTPRGDGFYYTWIPPLGPQVTVADRPGRQTVRFHKLGTDSERDPIVHPPTGDPRTFLDVEISRDGRWLIASIGHGWSSTDVYLRDLRARGGPAAAWRPFAVGIAAIFRVQAWKGRFYVLTDHGGPRWRLLRADAARPAMADWKEIVPESATAVLQGARVVGGHLALTYLENAAAAIEVRTLDGSLLRKVPLPGIGATRGLIGREEDDDAYFQFESFTRPPEIFRTSVARGDTTSWAKVSLPIDPAAFEVEQVWYPSHDGTRVSMFIVRRRDLRQDGSTPFLLAGYGGFNVSLLSSFSAELYPWLEAGAGYAVPNLRGGGEYGEEWHKAGMGERKQNVFDDFLAAAEYLVAQGYTRQERLAIRGGSNGGLLVGAAMTQRPDLFRAVVCSVPLLDMVRYHLFGSGKTWTHEYGTADEERAFKALHGYSPYHRVRPATRYPSMLLMSADSDDRVDPMHARKMTAAVQAGTASGRPVLLRIEKNAGHGGADLVRQAVEQSADAYAFVMNELGMRAAPVP